MGVEEDIRAVLDDPNEPFETAEQFVEAIEGMRGADHDEVDRSLDALEMAIEAARAKLRSLEDGTAFKR